MKNNNSKTIFLIGSTGKGKSSLANVLVNRVNEKGLFENFQEIFKESQASVSGTKKVQWEKFSEANINYAIIDTVGLGDTGLKREEVLDKLAEAVYLARNGIAHIFFVIGVKFDEKEMANYDLLKKIIFDKQVVNYTTIIRTRFENFKEEEDCRSDISLMLREGGKLAEIIRSCKENDEEYRVIHVDNPSLDLVAGDNEAEDEKEEIKLEIEEREETRSASRKKIIEHLEKICQKEEVYQPSKLKKLNDEISHLMEKKIENIEKREKIVGRLENKKKEITERESKKNSESENTDKKQKKIKFLDGLAEFLNKSFKTRKQKEDLIKEKKTVEKKDPITNLESEIEELKELKKLKEEIEKAEKLIQKIILRHIFDNIDDIKEVEGWETLFKNITDDDNFDSNLNNLNVSELKQRISSIQNEISEKKSDDKSLEDINKEIKEKEAQLFDLKKTNERKINQSRSQKWLDKEYPLENRAKIVKLEIANKNLHRSLDLSGFINLEKLDCHGNNISDLDLSDCSKLKELDCSSQINFKLSKLDLSSCPYLTKLDCSNNKISELDLSNCQRLVKIACNSNELDNLRITELPNIKELSCWNNRITEINWDALNPKNLAFLSVSNNNLSKQDLSCFSKFVNLEGLWIGTDVKDNLEKKSYNRFYGSLKPLQNLTRLKKLQIENTDVDSGLEFLPKSLEKIICWSPSHHEDFLAKNLEESLTNYKSYREEGDEEYYDIVKWRKDNLLLEKNLLEREIKKAIEKIVINEENNEEHLNIMEFSS